MSALSRRASRGVPVRSGGVAGIAVRLAAVGLLVGALTVLAVVAASVHAAFRHGDPAALAPPATTLVVLGGGINADGTLGAPGYRRLRTAIAALEAGHADRLLLSSGSRARSGLTEAEAMRDLALAEGIAPERIVVEPRSATTFENLRFSFRLAEERDLGRLALVTDPYHLPRAAALAAWYGRPGIGLLAARGVSGAPWERQVQHTVREALAWWYNLYKVAAWSLLGALGWNEAERAEIVR